MNSLINTTRKIRLNNFNIDNNIEILNIIDQIKSKLSIYTNSKFEDDSWVIKTNKPTDHSLSFKVFNLFIKGITELVKIFVLIILENNKDTIPQIKYLKAGFSFIDENNFNLYNLNKEIITIQFCIYLNSKIIKNSQKNKYFLGFKQFLFYMQGHPSIAKLSGLELINSPFKKDTTSKYNVISNETLTILDEKVNAETTPIHIKTAYWIMRLFATRPEETLSFPLHCVDKINDNIAIMKVFVGKQRFEILNTYKEKYHKIIYLDLSNQHMINLFNLIKNQQKIAENLQGAIEKKGYLFTYNPTTRPVTILKSNALRNNIIKIQKNNGIQNNRLICPRDFKKTGITKRVEWGFSNFEIKDIANHNKFESIDSYSAPSETFITNKQKKLLQQENRVNERYMFKGKIINGLNTTVEQRILLNPRAFKLPNMGYCSDINNCGNHFECLGCKDLIPEKELEGYYYEQAMFHLEKTKEQDKIGNKINAKDSLHRATLFNELWQKTRKNNE